MKHDWSRNLRDDLCDSVEIDRRFGFVEPCAVPMAGAKQSIPVAWTNSTHLSTGTSSPSDSEPTSSSIPRTASSSPSTPAPCLRAIATTSLVCRRFSSYERFEASNKAEFHPASKHVLMMETSGQ